MLATIDRHFTNEAVSLAIFIASYVLISARRLPYVRLNRPAASLLGAVAMVLATDITLEEACRDLVNWETIVLLLGMMLIVAYLRISYFFDWIAYYLLRTAHRPAVLVFLLVIACGVLSALFVNDTLCLMFTPIVLLVVARSGLNPVPFLLAVATGSNIGSVLTLTGNPQNMLVATSLARSHPEWTYARFTLYMLPIGLVSLAICAATIIWLYRSELRAGEVSALPSRPPRVRFRLMRKSIVVLAGTLVAFLLWPGHLPLAALAGGTAVMAWSRRKPERALAHVDWTLLLFFAALFVIIGGVDRSGIVEDIHRLAAPILRGSPGREVAVFSGVSVALSNLLSNVPYVAVAGTWVERFARPGLGWFTLAMASTFAGNLTIFGSVANMIVLELSREKVHIGFWEYCRTGVPVTIATTLVGIGVTWIYYALGVQ
jgi:Na+/H+ antiporter NhaD/arsenite permease-like protein